MTTQHHDDGAGVGEFDILEWIESGTVAQRTVVIYNDPALAAEFEELERRLARAEREAKRSTGEASVGDRDEVAEIVAAMESLYDRWEASKATWTVQALSDETVRDLAAAYPIPSKPEDVPADASDEVKAAHAEAMRDWLERASVAREERNLAYIAAAVVKVETAKGTARSVSVDALKKMRRGPHGEHRTTLLIQAVNAATQGDVEIPAPKSLGLSRSDRA